MVANSPGASHAPRQLTKPDDLPGPTSALVDTDRLQRSDESCCADRHRRSDQIDAREQQLHRLHVAFICWKTVRAVVPRWRAGVAGGQEQGGTRTQDKNRGHPNAKLARGEIHQFARTHLRDLRRQTIGNNCSTSSRAFTPSSAAGGIGPCLSTGEPASASPRAIAFQKSRAFTPSSAAGGIGPCLSTGEPSVAAAIKRSTLASPRASAFQKLRAFTPSFRRRRHNNEEIGEIVDLNPQQVRSSRSAPRSTSGACRSNCWSTTDRSTVVRRSR